MSTRRFGCARLRVAAMTVDEARRRGIDIGPKWIVVRNREQIIGDVHANGRRQAIEDLRRVFGGERHGTGAFNEVLIGSRLGGAITVWRPVELQDQRLFNTPPAPSRVEVTGLVLREQDDQ